MDNISCNWKAFIGIWLLWRGYHEGVDCDRNGSNGTSNQLREDQSETVFCVNDDIVYSPYYCHA
jgi:hypothetical protein